MLPVEKLNELLSTLEGENRISFNKQYAEEKYREYNGKKPIDDSQVISLLKNAIAGKTVCVIAPGMSLKKQGNKVIEAFQKADVTISLNCDVFETDYELITRDEIYRATFAAGKKLIVPSNVASSNSDHTYVINYFRWITIDQETRDSAGYLVINLLTELGAKKIFLAGFDGFTVDLNENYYNESLKRVMTPEQVKNLNQAFESYIKRKQKDNDITFITDSIYCK